MDCVRLTQLWKFAQNLNYSTQAISYGKVRNSMNQSQEKIVCMLFCVQIISCDDDRWRVSSSSNIHTWKWLISHICQKTVRFYFAKKFIEREKNNVHIQSTLKILGLGLSLLKCKRLSVKNINWTLPTQFYTTTTTTTTQHELKLLAHDYSKSVRNVFNLFVKYKKKHII